MSRLLKYITVCALWLAGIGLLGHTIIIHDHHEESSCFSGKEKCPATENANDHHTGSPIHCHAFNDIAAEKAVLYQFNSNIQCNELILSLTGNDFLFELSLCRCVYPMPQPPYLDPHLRYSTGLRAPPSFS